MYGTDIIRLCKGFTLDGQKGFTHKHVGDTFINYNIVRC